MKHGVTLFALLLWMQSSWAGQIELKQRLEFKWRGLTVATMNFAVSIPAEDVLSASDDGDDATSEPDVLIEVVGQTKGPLRWIEDYQATVRYMQIDSQGPVNAFMLAGTDNGQPERRFIVFDANRLPKVQLFDDSTASQALAPQTNWLDNTFNPLGVFKKMLLAAARQESCETDVWGYDGKRRYRLTLRDMPPVKGSAASRGRESLRQEETGYEYVCELTMHAEGRQSANMRASKSSFMFSKFGALWPFSDGDRRMTFVIRAQPIPAEEPVFRLVLTDIRIYTGMGAIVGSIAPQGGRFQ